MQDEFEINSHPKAIPYLPNDIYKTIMQFCDNVTLFKLRQTNIQIKEWAENELANRSDDEVFYTFGSGLYEPPHWLDSLSNKSKKSITDKEILQSLNKNVINHTGCYLNVNKLYLFKTLDEVKWLIENSTLYRRNQPAIFKVAVLNNSNELNFSKIKFFMLTSIRLSGHPFNEYKEQNVCMVERNEIIPLEAYLIHESTSKPRIKYSHQLKKYTSTNCK